MNKKHVTGQPELSDVHQSYWQLAAIQLSGWTSLPILSTSIIILEKNSFLGAILTIIVGNALLWFLRLGIISMSYKKRMSTLDISEEYLGNNSKYIVSALLILSTVVYFVAQTSAVSGTITSLFKINESSEINQFTQISIFIGVVSTLLCMEGMSLLKKLSTILFPILLCIFFIIIFVLPTPSNFYGEHPLSFAGLTLVLATDLGITSDLPTFFRHSRSWQDSVKALTIIQLACLGLGLLSLYFSAILNENFGINADAVFNSGSVILRYSLIIFVFLSGVCSNVANVYSASVGWEVIAPTALVGRKEYLIMGFGLSIIFILISGLFSVGFLLEFFESSLVNLCLVLIVGSMVRRLKKYAEDYMRSTCLIAWILSTTINLCQLTWGFLSGYSLILVSLVVVLLFVSISIISRSIFNGLCKN